MVNIYYEGRDYNGRFQVKQIKEKKEVGGEE